MIGSLALLTFPGVPFSSPLTCPDAATSQLLESVSSELVTTGSEPHSTLFARGCSVWSRAIEGLSFIGGIEVSTGIQRQEFGSQNVIGSWEGLEYVTMGYLRHHLLDEFIILLYVTNGKYDMSHQRILQHGFCPDDFLWDLGYSLLHSVSELFSGLGLVATALIQKLADLHTRKGFHLLMGVNPLKEFQSAFVVYAAKGVKSLWEVVFKSIGELVREPDFLLNQSISVLQQESQFSYVFIRYLHRSESFLMFPDIVSNEMGISRV